MVEKIANRIGCKLIAVGAATQEQKARLIYGLFCLLSGTVQICLLLLLSLLLQITVEVASFVLMFSSLKRTIGGWHAKSNHTCLIYFTSIAIICSAMSNYIAYPFLLPCTLILSIWMLIIVWLFAPVQHYNNPQTTQRVIELKLISKRIAVFDFALLLICSLLMYETEYAHIVLSGSMGSAVAATLLLFPNKPPTIEKGEAT